MAGACDIHYTEVSLISVPKLSTCYSLIGWGFVMVTLLCIEFNVLAVRDSWS
jgi:hypothetical protein